MALGSVAGIVSFSQNIYFRLRFQNNLVKLKIPNGASRKIRCSFVLNLKARKRERELEYLKKFNYVAMIIGLFNFPFTILHSIILKIEITREMCKEA